ncbi:hypothetical protein GCM10018775_88250 [Streptomyces umbrinus]|nr:hypothetical protein GCM10018775_88250 [Streptomyces umbrinus]
MNHTESDQVAHLLADAVQDITHSPEELSARLAQLKGHAASEPAPLPPASSLRLMSAPASSASASQEAAGSGPAVYGTLAVGAATAAATARDPADSRSGLTRDRSTPLKVDAQRNLEHVLRAAREVFGELGYGAPMEDVARRARVGVGTVYRRFPSKDVLVRRIAEEEVSRLTDHARVVLGQEDEPWSALARFVRTSVASGGGRLIPAVPLHDDQADPDVEHHMASLMEVVGQLVHRAHASGELRPDVTVADVLLLISSSPSRTADAALQAARQGRLLDICLDGLRSRSE